MPYIKTTIKAGRTIEVHKTYSGRYGVKGIPRAPNRNKTPEQMLKANYNQARKKLRGQLNENFKCGDYHLIATYRREERPTPERAKDQLNKFLDRLRKLYLKSDEKLKYIAVTEYKNTAIHHHIIVNNFDLKQIVKKWPYGRIQVSILDDTGDYSKLADYLIKETEKTFRDPDAPTRKRWRSSKNLKQPQVKKKVIRARSWSNEPKPVKGYYIVKDSIETGINPVNGYPYQSYRMVKLKNIRRDTS